MEKQEFHIQESMSPAELELKYRLSMEKNAELVFQVSSLKDENARLKEQLAWFQKAVYGQKSERTDAGRASPGQRNLVDEAAHEADAAVLAW